MNDRPTVLAGIIHGKLAVLDGREDHLTALVLGVMAWLPVSMGITPLLTLAVNERREGLGWGGGITSCTVSMWPWWDQDAVVSGAEPDAVLLLDGPGGRRLIVVESKWRAEKSGTGAHDQLLRQHANGRMEAERLHARFIGVLYVTTHLGLPVVDLAASRTAIETDGRLGSATLGWVSWRDATPILERAAAELADVQPLLSRLCADAVDALRGYGLDRFRGLPVPQALPHLRFRWAANLTTPTSTPPLPPAWRSP